MDMQDAIKAFKKIYPDDFITVFKTKQIYNNTYILGASFPDGNFYFVIDGKNVSNSFNDYDSAKKSIY